MAKNLCYGKLTIVKRNRTKTIYDQFYNAILDAPAKRLRLVCPVCKRRLESSVSLCQDGCCIIHSLPPHKPKYWWKKKHHIIRKPSGKVK